MWEISNMNILLLLSYFNFVVWGNYHLLHISIVSQALNRFTLQIMTDVEKSSPSIWRTLLSLWIVIILCTCYLKSFSCLFVFGLVHSGETEIIPQPCVFHGIYSLAHTTFLPKICMNKVCVMVSVTINVSAVWFVNVQDVKVKAIIKACSYSACAFNVWRHGTGDFW